jgi:hypothetical protein
MRSGRSLVGGPRAVLRIGHVERRRNCNKKKEAEEEWILSTSVTKNTPWMVMFCVRLTQGHQWVCFQNTWNERGNVPSCCYWYKTRLLAYTALCRQNNILHPHFHMWIVGFDFGRSLQSAVSELKPTSQKITLKIILRLVFLDLSVCRKLTSTRCEDGMLGFPKSLQTYDEIKSLPFPSASFLINYLLSSQ